MKFIQGHNRNQINLFPVSLDETIDSDNEVRIIDLFVDSLSIKDYGFRTDFQENGRPAYHPTDLLKLFIYGYLNMVLSSRDLERECRRNIVVMWLLKCLTPDHAYNYEDFKYDLSSDTYTCPQGEVLKTNGRWYTTHGRRNILILFKQYKTKICKSCPARMKCTRSKTGRLIERSIYAEYYERNKKNIVEKEHLYKRRQAIAEHPFGTIKRQWGFSYVLTKRGINRASF